MRTDTAIFVHDDDLSISKGEYENGSGIIHIKIGESRIQLYVQNEAQFIALCADHNLKEEK